MPATRSQMVIDAVVARLQAVQVANGYNTDSGLHVNTAEALDADTEVPGFVVTSEVEDYAPASGDGAVDGSGASYRVTQTIVIASASTPTGIRGEALELQLGDAKRALCLAGPMPLLDSDGAQLGKLAIVRTVKLPRASGEAYDGFEMTISCWHIEAWGDPYSLR